ncbi:zinc finger BED domain-containing protein 1-like [Scomber scombrus]|uniref:Zinc finger BED domain-containing protein 1-like n=1 Tax=Scomber scombrus TaxID=13677 RepID=A0AAV1N5D5_SCOSC
MAWIPLLPPPLPQMILMHINLKRTAAKLAEDDGTLNERPAAEPVGDHQSSHGWDDNDKEKEKEAETEPPKKKSPLDQMFGGFLTPRAPKKSIRDRAQEEIAKYRGRDC